MIIFIINSAISSYVWTTAYTYEYMWKFLAILAGFSSIFSASMGICYHNLKDIEQIPRVENKYY